MTLAYYRKNIYLVICILLILAGLSLAAAEPAAEPVAGDMALLLVELQSVLQGDLSDLANGSAQAALQLGSTGLEGLKARQILQSITDSYPGLTEVIVFDREGRILAASPAQYSSWEGSNISGQEHVSRFLRELQPLFSQMFQTVEGYYAVTLMRPVFSEEGEVLGGLSTTLQPDRWVRPALDSRLNGTGYNAWMMQRDGLVLFDVHPDEVGTRLFDDPLYEEYPDLVELSRRIAASRYGQGEYLFSNDLGGEDIKKVAIWTTVGLFDTEWRLVLTRVT